MVHKLQNEKQMNTKSVIYQIYPTVLVTERRIPDNSICDNSISLR